MQVTQVLAVESSEHKVNFLFDIRNVTKRSQERTEMLSWNHPTSWVQTEQLVVGPVSHDRIVRLAFEHIVDLAIAEEKHYAGLHLVLENKVLVVVANLNDV